MDDKKLPNHWIKVKSKSREDKFYYFNKKTGKSTWNIQNVYASQQESPQKPSPILGISNNSRQIKRNLANDRLDKFREKLKTEIDTKKSPQKVQKKQLPETKKEETTSTNVQSTSKTSQLQHNQNSKSNINDNNAIKKPNPTELPKNNNNNNQPNVAKKEAPQTKQKTVEPKKELSKIKQKAITKNRPNKTVNSAVIKTVEKLNTSPSSRNNPVVGLFTSVYDAGKNLCKILTGSDFKIPKKAPETQVKPQAVVVPSTSNEIKNNVPQLEQKKAATSTTPKPLESPARPIPSFVEEKKNGSFRDTSLNVLKNEILTPKSAANNRLQRLREQLTVEAAEETKNKSIDEDMDCLMTDDESNDTNEPEPEPMEWDDISEQNVIEEVQAIRAFKSVATNDMRDMILNHNVAAIPEDSALYIILDTNIFISNLDFVQKLKGRVFKDIGTAVIYLPYIVLIELDKLKNGDSNLAKYSRRAINFINEEFKKKDPYIKGQSALQDDETLISISGGDDSILNCCLQIRKMTTKMILLSNDINLRNKAFVNNIHAFSTQMLIDNNFDLNCLLN